MKCEKCDKEANIDEVNKLIEESRQRVIEKIKKLIDEINKEK